MAYLQGTPLTEAGKFIGKLSRAKREMAKRRILSRWVGAGWVWTRWERGGNEVGTGVLTRAGTMPRGASRPGGREGRQVDVWAAYLHRTRVGAGVVEKSWVQMRGDDYSSQFP